MPELGHLDRCPDGVSYGDMVLATVAGKLLGRLVSITGVGTRALFSVTAGAEFVGADAGKAGWVHCRAA
jgi:hypothetical protein